MHFAGENTSIKSLNRDILTIVLSLIIYVVIHDYIEKETKIMLVGVVVVLVKIV